MSGLKVTTKYDKIGTLKERLQATLVHQAYLRTSRWFLRHFIEEMGMEKSYKEWKIKKTKDFEKIENYYLQEIEQKIN